MGPQRPVVQRRAKQKTEGMAAEGRLYSTVLGWGEGGMLHTGLSLNPGSGTLLTVGFEVSSIIIVSFIILIPNTEMIMMIEHLPHNCYKD